MSFTRRHRFVNTFLYELPFGRDRRFASGIGRGLDLLIGGWDVTRITLFQSSPTADAFFDRNARSDRVRSRTAACRIPVRYRHDRAWVGGQKHAVRNLDIPNTNITSSSFGRVTDAQTVDQAGPRTVQLSLRYVF